MLSKILLALKGSQQWHCGVGGRLKEGQVHTLPTHPSWGRFPVQLIDSAGGPTASHSNHICTICGETVGLEFCKSDEDGQVVHEKCYVAKVAADSRADSSGLHQAVRALLLAASTAEAHPCPTCGETMTHIAVTFFFDGSPWEVPVPFCPVCTPATSSLRPSAATVN
jgi:hypothetical protein